MTVIQKELDHIVLVRIEGPYDTDGAVVVTSDGRDEMGCRGLL